MGQLVYGTPCMWETSSTPLQDTRWDTWDISYVRQLVYGTVHIYGTPRKWDTSLWDTFYTGHLVYGTPRMQLNVS